MDYRTGKCSQCGAEYKVPASFAHNVARCKQCKGVVHLGPAQGAASAATPPAAVTPPAPAPSAMPAKKVVPKPAAPSAPRPAAPEAAKGAPAAPSARPPAPKSEPAPAEKKGGTLERLKAERQSQGQAQPSKAAPPAPPTPAPAAAKPAASKASATSSRPTPAAAAPAAPARPARAQASQAEDDEGDDAKSARGGRRGAKERPAKKRPIGGLLSVVGLVLVTAVLVLFRDSLFKTGEEEAAPGTVEAGAKDPAAAAPGETAPTATPTEASATPANEPPKDVAPEAETAREPVAEEAPAPEKEPVAEAEPPKKEADPKVKDPASIDLAALPDFGPTPDTTPEEWATMQKAIEQWMDPEAGAAGNRARLKLEREFKRRAVPVILNHMKKLDFATAQGRKAGDQCQTTLKEIWNGINFDWRYPDDAAGKPVTDPGDVWFCKRATELWCSLWRQTEDNIEIYIERAKLREKDPAEAERLLQLFGKKSESGDEPASERDDLEVD